MGYSEVKENKMEDVKHLWRTQPFALIECKKIAGGPELDNSILKSTINSIISKCFLIKELDILKPNIIVCCDSEGIIFDFVINEYMKGKEGREIHYCHPAYKRTKVKCRLVYYPDEKVIVIHSYHPNRLGKSDDIVYERVISPFGTLMHMVDAPLF